MTAKAQAQNNSKRKSRLCRLRLPPSLRPWSRVNPSPVTQPDSSDGAKIQTLSAPKLQIATTENKQ